VEDVRCWKNNPTVNRWLAEKAAREKQSRSRAMERAQEVGLPFTSFSGLSLYI
jgi:hypothetical protein